MRVSHKPMRPSRRFLPLPQVIFVFVFLLPGALAAPEQSAQLPAEQLPSKWSDAVHSLADRIAGASPARAAFVFDLKNISSLNASDAGSVREAIQTELTRRGFRIASSASTGIDVRLTLSEGSDSYVWVAEWRGKDEPQTAIVAVPKTSDVGVNGTKNSVRLESKLVWQQPDRLLDFAVLTSSDNSAPTIVTLEPGHVRWYSFGAFQRGFSHGFDVGRKTPWPRDVRGIIDVEGKKVLLPEMECQAEIENPTQMKCIPSKDATLLEGPRIRVPGHEGSESALLGERCDGRFVILASGNGDWTQPDSIQGYALADLEGQAAVSGSPIEFDGPVLALYREGKQSAARAVVHNLKTGNYEAYIVTATCSH
jgi:hypothetical protein